MVGTGRLGINGTGIRRTRSPITALMVICPLNMSPTALSGKVPIISCCELANETYVESKDMVRMVKCCVVRPDKRPVDIVVSSDGHGLWYRIAMDMVVLFIARGSTEEGFPLLMEADAGSRRLHDVR